MESGNLEGQLVWLEAAWCPYAVLHSLLCYCRPQSGCVTKVRFPLVELTARVNG